jgi:ureidoacrylate peracid hydrolase
VLPGETEQAFRFLTPDFIVSADIIPKTGRRKMKIRFHAQPEDLELDTRSAAVVVVDMQNAFAVKNGVFDLAGIDISRAPQIIRAIRAILETSRDREIKVVYLQMGYKQDLSNAGGPDSPNRRKELALVLMRDHPQLEEKPLLEGTWNFDIVDELSPHPGDLVVVKSRYSGFAGTKLDPLLRSMGIRYLFFTGMATNVCVESTLRDAYCLDYWPILITDATLQAGPELLQQATIQNVKIHFGWTLAAQEFLKSLNSADCPS